MSVMAVTDDPILLLIRSFFILVIRSLLVEVITKIFNNIFSLIVSSCISDLGSVFLFFSYLYYFALVLTNFHSPYFSKCFAFSFELIILLVEKENLSLK